MLMAAEVCTRCRPKCNFFSVPGWDMARQNYPVTLSSAIYERGTNRVVLQFSYFCSCLEVKKTKTVDRALDHNVRRKFKSVCCATHKKMTRQISWPPTAAPNIRQGIPLRVQRTCATDKRAILHPLETNEPKFSVPSK